jgi:outer membrane lipoprotein-sorting protein
MKLTRIAAVVAAVSIAVTASPAAPPAGESLPQVLERFDRVQASIRTLSAQFVQTTRNPILKEPTVAEGRVLPHQAGRGPLGVHLTRADALLRRAGEYTGYFPERKRAERRDIKRWSEQLFRFFGLGQGSAELGKFYEIALGDPGPEMKGSYLLVLSPKKRRVKKNVEEVKLWVDATNLLPVRIDYIGKDGGGREIRFAGTRLNPDLSAALYHVDIPKDVPVSNGFSGLDLSSARSSH